MSFLTIIAQKKHHDKEKAFLDSIAIYDESKTVIGYLVAIGNWVFADDVFIEQMMLWRKRFRSFFFTEFDESIESTTYFLTKFAIGNQQQILFAIYGADKTLIGHIGIAKYSAISGNIDNIVRGVSGGHVNLMYFAQKVLINWAFTVLNFDRVRLCILSNNLVAKMFHERFGFKIIASRYLKKQASEDGINTNLFVHVECDKSHSNVAYCSETMELSKANFLSSMT